MENHREAFRADLYRYFGPSGVSVRGLWQERVQISFLWRFRKSQYARGKFSKVWNRFLLARAARRTLLQFFFGCQVGPGLRLGHLGPVIVNGRARIGMNCNISSGVTIGAANRGRLEGSPTLGDRVWVGTNAVIVGRITIGSDVLIAPNAYVNFDVPDHSVVVGNPGVIHQSRDATAGYIENVVSDSSLNFS